MITRETIDAEYCTIAEAAQLLHVSKPTVSRWIHSGRLPAVRRGPRAMRIRRADLRQLDRPAIPRRYTLPRPAPTMTEEELMAEIEAINDRIRARNGGKLLDSSVPLIHEQRR